MPGPKMGARPLDFDESVVRQAPTFIRWQALEDGQKLRYSCRDFIKGHGDDEERLMRRITIARRNNLRDHEMLKRARMKTTVGNCGWSETDLIVAAEAVSKAPELPLPTAAAVGVKNPSKEPKVEEVGTSVQALKKRRIAGSNAAFLSDDEILREIDLPAVERTRSYKTWCALKHGQIFTYNQRYVKGKEGHEWLLKKNIWRRMRYRRENKMMVEKMKNEKPNVGVQITPPSNSFVRMYCDHAAISNAAATQIVDQTLLTANNVVDLTGIRHGISAEEAAAATTIGLEDGLIQRAVVEAAVAASESYVQNARHFESVAAAMPIAVKEEDTIIPNNLLVGLLNDDALGVAAKLAAAASAQLLNDFNNSAEGTTSTNGVEV